MQFQGSLRGQAVNGRFAFFFSPVAFKNGKLGISLATIHYFCLRPSKNDLVLCLWPPPTRSVLVSIMRTKQTSGANSYNRWWCHRDRLVGHAQTVAGAGKHAAVRDSCTICARKIDDTIFQEERSFKRKHSCCCCCDKQRMLRYDKLCR